MKPALRTWSHLALSVSILALSTSFALGASLKGKIKKNVYHSPAGNFTVPLPSDWAGRIGVNDSYDEKNRAGAVSFHSDWGMQQGIHYMLLPPDDLTNQQLDSRDVLARWLHDFAMQVWFLHVFPKSRVLQEEFASFEGLNTLLARVEIPEGSSMVNMMTKKRLNSLRGLVIFQKDRYIYMLTTEVTTTDILDPGKKTDGQSEKWTAFADELKPFYKSIVFAE